MHSALSLSQATFDGQNFTYSGHVSFVVSAVTVVAGDIVTENAVSFVTLSDTDAVSISVSGDELFCNFTWTDSVEWSEPLSIFSVTCELELVVSNINRSASHIHT